METSQGSTQMAPGRSQSQGRPLDNAVHLPDTKSGQADRSHPTTNAVPTRTQAQRSMVMRDTGMKARHSSARTGGCTSREARIPAIHDDVTVRHRTTHVMFIDSKIMKDHHRAAN